MENLVEVLPILHEKTLVNKIEWTTSGRSMIKTIVNEFTIGITRHENYSVFEMALYDEKGRAVEEIIADEDDDCFQILKEIFVVADRRERKVDESISKVKSLLEAL